MKKRTVKKPVNKKDVKKVIKGLKKASAKLGDIKIGIDTAAMNTIVKDVAAAAGIPERLISGQQTLDSLFKAVPEGWDVILRNDKEKGFFAHVFTTEKRGSQPPQNVSFPFHGNTPVAALSRAVDMAVAFQDARDAEAKDNRKPMAMLCISEDLVPIVQKAIDEAVK